MVTMIAHASSHIADSKGSALYTVDCFQAPRLPSILLALTCVLLIAAFLLRTFTSEEDKHVLARYCFFAATLCGTFFIAAYL